MSNGVGFIAAVSGSIPRVPGPRPSDPDPEASRSAGRPIETPGAGRRPSRGSDSGLAPRLRAEAAPGTARPSRTVPVAGSSRSESLAARPVPSRELVRRLGEALQSAPLRDGTRVRLSLSPAHLGDVWIELSVAGSRLSGRVRTGTWAARDLILSHLDDLRRDLEKRGIRIRHLEVEVAEGRGKAEAGPRSHRKQVLDLQA